MPSKSPRDERSVSSYWYQCVAGPDLLTVQIEDDTATEIRPNFAAADVHPAGGKVCVKVFGLVQKAYNPDRILHPMKRTKRPAVRIRDSSRFRGTRRSTSWQKSSRRRARQGPRRNRLSAPRRELRRGWHADRLRCRPCLTPGGRST
jgi:anaerobic selenocysteine-containing dehydrogenase